ncbi:MAG TPA: hypothetical protein VIN59_01645 [Alphaproteobacteria bacterium]
MLTEKTLKVMGVQDFANFGVPIVAYVKPVDVDGHRAFALMTADGNEIETLATEDMAAISAHKRNLLPVVVH